VLVEVFAARPDELDEDVIENGPLDRLPSVEVNFLGPATIETLGGILGTDGRPNAAPEPLFSVPTQVRDTLADSSDLADVAARWAQTEELRMDEVTAEDAQDRLEELAALARAARTDGRELWVWFSV
jgi:hypothetical protein